ncbi:MAG: sn-glycerol-1-phosphate dehydrogenase [Abditibacteriales bacterium]|nr:sn-glycerol-1-phosphate dehydrogenase [Abditibacteriales bacterium]MDW8364535.1 sn-glycerol-1-phosphate dehydrogenase [Abditibacteriales bacterium]
MAHLLERLESLCGHSWLCACGRRHAIPTQQVIIEENAADQLPASLNALCGAGAVVVVADQTTRAVLGRRVEHLLRAAGRAVSLVIFEAGLEAAAEAVQNVVAAVRHDVAALVSVGAGVINDITKMAAHRTGRKYISVATAPSQNGFASPIAAFTEDGIKVTHPAAPPIAVVGDSDTLAHAPPPLIRAGFADLLGRTTANADWLLAHLVKGEYYCPRPLEIVVAAEAACRNEAAAIGRAEPHAVETLMAALVLSGFSMVIAGSSAPASGGEHLISHYLDGQHEWHGHRSLEQRLHGLQVGVTTLMMARLYERLLSLSASDINLAAIRRRYPSWEEEEKTIRRFYGAAATAALEQFHRKYQPWDKKEAELRALLNRWDDLRATLRSIVSSPASLADALQAAGAFTQPSELGLSSEQMREALLNARYLRSRYTVLDLAAEVGVLREFAQEL